MPTGSRSSVSCPTRHVALSNCSLFAAELLKGIEQEQ